MKMLGRVSVFALLLLTSCARVHEPSVSVKSAADYKIAHDVSYKLAPLVFPKIEDRETYAKLRTKAHDVLVKAAEETAGSDKTKQCFTRIGILDILEKSILQELTPEALKNKLADDWTDSYTTLQLQKFYNYYTSPLVRRLAAHKFKEAGSAKAMEQELISSGTFTSAEVQQLAALTDAEIALFASRTDKSLASALELIEARGKASGKLALYDFVDAHRQEIATCSASK